MPITGEQRPEYYAFAEQWLATKLPRAYDSRVLTNVDADGRPIGCIVYSHITDKNLEMAVVTPNGRGLNLEFLYRMFAYPFLQLRLPHVSTIADEANHASIKLTLHAGFTIEGRMRRIHNGRDGIIFGMCRDECRWIRPEIRSRYHG